MTSILVIGSNRGIGLEITRQLVARGDDVIGACRKPSPELEALDVRVEPEVDISSRDSLDRLAKKLGPASLDGIFVVAGILEQTPWDDLNTDSIRRQFEVNAVGPLVAVHSLQECIKNGGKVALLTSRVGSIADNGSGGNYGYRMSKAALNMAGSCLAHELRDREIAVCLLHPGYVRTEMTGGSGHISPDESASGLITRYDELKLAESGSFLHQNGERLPW